MKFKIKPEDIAKMPGPLASSVQVWIDEDPNQPFRCVHRLIDVIEVFCKLHTVATVATFLDIIKQEDSNLHSKQKGIQEWLSMGLATPSLGTWRLFGEEISKVIHELGEEHILENGLVELTGKKFNSKKDGEFYKGFTNDKNYVSFRNSLAHGATPDDADCKKLLNEFGQKLEKLILESNTLQSCKWILCDDKGLVFESIGNQLIPFETDLKLTNKHVYLLRNDRCLDLFPLLQFDKKADKAGYYFHNDIKKEKITILNYPNADHITDKDLFIQFLQRIPIEDWKPSKKVDMDPFLERIQELTESFKGRSEEIKTILNYVSKNEYDSEKSKGFLLLLGNAGVGKSALLARIKQILSLSFELRSESVPDFKSDLNYKFVDFFIRKGTSFDNSNTFYESVTQRLDKMFELKEELGKTDLEKQSNLEKRFKSISSKLPDNERLILIVDGLDEIKEGDPLLELLPRISSPKIFIVYGGRPTDKIKSTFYESLEREFKISMDIAGLKINDIRALLMERVNKYELQPEYIKHILQKSDGNPLYLKLLCQGLEDKIYKLNDKVGLPKNFEEIYKATIDSLNTKQPGSEEFLKLLAIAKDFVSPAMAAHILGKDPIEYNLIIKNCLELLYENTATRNIEDYQLFHESLREYLIKDGKNIFELSEKITHWCTAKNEKGDSVQTDVFEKLYAYRYACEHLYDSWLHNKEISPNLAKERADKLIETVESEKWREDNFFYTGNPISLQTAFKNAQKILKSDGNFDNLKLFEYSLLMHHEPIRLFQKQLEELKKAHNSDELVKNMEKWQYLANMGEHSVQKLMLLYLAFWNNLQKIKHLPEELAFQNEEWLELANDLSMSKLWKITNNRLPKN